jgi:hypothetical protein
MRTILLATSADHPALHADDLPLVRALEPLGFRAEPRIWNAPGIAWDHPVVIRSVWDYHLHAPEFLAWAERVSARVPMLNPFALVEWNSHKTYLRDLAGRGVATVPTLWVEDGVAPPLDDELDARGWGEIVIKPAVSASAHGAKRFTRERRAEARAHLLELAARGTVIVQPYLSSVEGYGERSFIHIEGEFTHGVKRQAVLSMPFEMEAPAPRVEPTDPERALCAAALGALTERPLYARIDMAPDDRGAPRLMELELIEPRLYLREEQSAAVKMARGIVARLSATD